LPRPLAGVEPAGKSWAVDYLLFFSVLTFIIELVAISTGGLIITEAHYLIVWVRVLAVSDNPAPFFAAC